MSKPKKLLGPNPSPKNSSIGPQKPRNDLRKKEIKKSENKISHRIKVISLDDYTPKKILGPHPSPKNSSTNRKSSVNISKAIKTFRTPPPPKKSPIGTQKAQNSPKKAEKQKGRKQKNLAK